MCVYVCEVNTWQHVSRVHTHNMHARAPDVKDPLLVTLWCCVAVTQTTHKLFKPHDVLKIRYDNPVFTWQRYAETGHQGTV